MAQPVPAKKRTLIICREPSAAPLLSQIRPETQEGWVVASDDIRVQEFAKQYAWVDEVCWIEQMESFYQVANDVIIILEAVNRWLKSLGNTRFGIPADLLFWIRHAEGGKTTQHIQIALLLIRSYLHLLEIHSVKSIILLRNSTPCWEDDVLIQTARSRGIFVQEIGFLNRKNGLKYRIKCLKLRVIIYSKYFLRVPHHVYRICKIIQAHYRQRTRHIEKRGVVSTVNHNEIVFQLCSSGDSHVENIVPLMKALQQKGYKPVALCWGANQGAEKVRQEGLYAEELERFIPVHSSYEAPYRVFYTRIKANRRIKQFFNIPELKYQSVPLRALLWPSIQHFLLAELSQRCRLQLALKEYFRSHSPLAIKLWGGGKLIEGALVLKSLNADERPVLMYWFWLVFDYPYESKCDYDNVDLLLTAGKSQDNYLAQLGVSSKKIVSVGMGRYGHLSDFKRKYSRDKSRSHLTIPQGYITYIFYDSGTVLKGYLSTREQFLTTDALLDFAREHPSVALVIKPHPSHNSGMLESLVEHYALPNVFLVDRAMLPYHALNAADLVITKISTVGIEAMLLQRPVISVMLDGETRWRSYGNAAEYMTSTEELTSLLTRLAGDRDSRISWTANQISKQKDFLKEYFVERTQPASEHAADIIDEFIRQKKVKCPPLSRQDGS